MDDSERPAGVASAPAEVVSAGWSAAETKVETLQGALAQNPEDSQTRRELYHAVHALVREDAFLGYAGETADAYRVRRASGFGFTYPKDRAPREPFPPATPAPSRTALRWLGWSVAGLAPAGLGTLVCAPLAMYAAFKLLRSRPAPPDRARAVVVLVCAVALWWLAVFGAGLLILHLA